MFYIYNLLIYKSLKTNIMKKLFTLIFAIATITAFAQEKCSFYVEKGTKEVSSLNCGEFSDLQVKVTIPANTVNFDKLRIIYTSTDGNVKGVIDYTGKGAIGTVAGKTMNYWIANPNNKNIDEDSPGDFLISGGKYYVSMDNLCKYPKKRNQTSITVTIKVVGFAVTGKEEYWSKTTKSYLERDLYDDGTTLSIGSIDISLTALGESYTEDNLIINFQDPKITFVKTNSNATSSNLFTSIKFKEIKVNLVEEGKNIKEERTTITFKQINENLITGLASYKKAKTKQSDYSPVQYMKDVSDLWYAHNSTGCSPVDEVKKSKMKPEIEMSRLIGKGFVEDLRKNKNIQNTLYSGKKNKDAFTVWSKKNIGSVNYDYGYIDKVHKARCLSGKLEYNPEIFEPVEFYLIYKKPYIYIIDWEVYQKQEKNDIQESDFSVEQRSYGIFYDKNKQMEYIKFILSNIKFTD